MIDVKVVKLTLLQPVTSRKFGQALDYSALGTN